MKSLESIIEGGLYSLEDDTIDIPHEEVTSDEYNEVVLDGINESATVEQFIMWSKNAQEHLRVLASISTESDSYRTLEADTLKKIGQGIKDAIKAIITNFINFIKKTINYFRSIGIKKKCEFIEKNQRWINNALIEKHGKGKKFIDPDIVEGVKNLCNNSYSDSIFNISFFYTINVVKDNKIAELAESYKTGLKTANTDAVDMVNIYRRSKLWTAEKFFTHDYEKLLGKFNTLSGKLSSYFKDRKDKDNSENEIKMSKDIHTMYNLCINATGKWIGMTAFMYKLCKNAVNEKNDLKYKPDPIVGNDDTRAVGTANKPKQTVVEKNTDEWSEKNDGFEYEVVNERFHDFFSLVK